VTLTGEEIRVRDGQRVSIISGCRKDRRSTIIVFINHDDNNKGYWIGTPNSFFKRLEIFICFPDDNNKSYGIGTPIEIVYPEDWFVYGFICAIFVIVINIMLSNFLIMAIAGIFLIAVIIFFIIQENRIRSAWDIVEPQIRKIVRQLNINSN
jgi:hypothetical protein